MTPRILFLYAALALSSRAQAAAGCAQLQAAVQGALRCQSAGSTLIVTREPVDMQPIVDAVREAEARFQALFGRAAPATVFAYGISKDDAQAFKIGGIRRVLPFPTAAQLNAVAIASLRQQAEAKAQAAGLDEARVRDVAAQAEAHYRAAKVPAARDATQLTVIRHELGHLWFTQAFWPEAAAAPATGTLHYGGPAPDWMDESAALLVEDAPSQDDRRQAIATIMAGHSNGATFDIAPEELADLSGLLDRAHPMLQRVQRGSGAATTVTPGVRMLVGEEAAVAARNAYGFYLQALAFADYLQARDKRGQPLATIANALARGESFETWLSHDGQKHGLPATRGALQSDYRGWLIQAHASANRPSAAR